MRYHPGSDLQSLDIFAPRGARDCPVILLVHGGGWMIGDKDMFGLYRRVGRFLAKQGYVAVAINYRLSPAVQHPEHVKDVARAFAWIRRQIRTYGGNPDRIILAGHSAGGHLVALLASDDRYLKDPELKLTDRDRAAIRGVVAISGVYRIPESEEFHKMVSMMAEAVLELSGNSPLLAAMLPALIPAVRSVNVFQIVFGQDKDVRMQASPINQVRPGLPPFLILYGDRDLPLLGPMAREFHAALKKAGSAAELCPIDDRNHNTIMFRLHQPDDPTGARILAFLQRVLNEKAR